MIRYCINILVINITALDLFVVMIRLFIALIKERLERFHS